MSRDIESNLGVRRIKVVLSGLVLVVSLGVTATLAIVDLPQGGKLPMVLLGLIWSAALFALFWVRNIYVRAAAAAITALMLVASFNSPGPSGQSLDSFLWTLIGGFLIAGVVVPVLMFVVRWVWQGFKASQTSAT